MPNRLCTTLTIYTLLTCVLIPRECNSLLMVTSDTPGPISQLLQLVWEPSSLIRMWTALDQLYNVFLGWRSAARTVVELPFRQGRSMSHVRIQEPRRYNRRQQGMSSDMPPWDWFKKVYEESVNDPAVGTAESYHRGFEMVAEPSLNAPVVNRNVPLDMQQSSNVLTDHFQNSLNVPGGNDNDLFNLQQSLSADRNVPFPLQQSPNGLRGNVYNSLNVPGADVNALPIFQRYLSAQSGNVHNSLNDPGANRNFFQTLQQSINSFKDVFRSTLNAPGANGNALATLQQSLNAFRGNFHKPQNSPEANFKDLLFLHQLQNTPGVLNNVQTDIRNQHLIKSQFPFHLPKMFSDYNRMEFPNKNDDFRRNVKVSQPNNYAHNNGHTTSEQNTMKGHSSASVPLMFFNVNSVPNSNPETRLRMFLKLMGQLGEMHKKNIKPVEFDDDVNERRSDMGN